jgi:hypothetical protein
MATVIAVFRAAYLRAAFRSFSKTRRRRRSTIFAPREVVDIRDSLDPPTSDRSRNARNAFRSMIRSVDRIARDKFSRGGRHDGTGCAVRGLINASGHHTRVDVPRSRSLFLSRDSRDPRDSAIMRGRWSKGRALADDACISPVSTVEADAKAPLIRR